MPNLRIGSKLRHADGTLAHVRGFVDGRIIIRWWSTSKRRWHYDVISQEVEMKVGLYTRT